MPTILIQAGFRFFIPTLDHAPAHVHVAKGSAEAKFNLDPIELVTNRRMRNHDLAAALAIIIAQQQNFLAAWKEIHPDL